MKLIINDFRCDKCGFTIERLAERGVDIVTSFCNTVACDRLDLQKCELRRVVATPRFKIDVEAKAFVPTHVKRARNLGHGGANSKTEGAYSHLDSPKDYKKKIMVGPR